MISHTLYSPWVLVSRVLLGCFLFLSLCCFSLADSDNDQYLTELNEIANFFKQEECPKTDPFCWWFKFHILVGEEDLAELENFLATVPVEYGFDLYDRQQIPSFRGEGHVLQYTAYYLLKGGDLSQKISTGETLSSYLTRTNWHRLLNYLSKFKNAHQRPENISYVNAEASWLFITNHFVNQWRLQKYTQFLFLDKHHLSCAESHFLLGLYFYRQSLFEKYFQHYHASLIDRLRQKEFHQFADYDIETIFYLTHVVELYHLTEKEQYLTPEIQQAIAQFIELYIQEFDQEESYSDQFLYISADVLGHLRYGLILSR